MNSVTLSRHVALETVSVEAFLTVDGQGLPTYDSPVDVDARVLQQTKLVVAVDGSRTKTSLSLWVPNGAALMPDEQDRVVWSSRNYIVVDVKHVKDRDAQTIHRRVRCRRE